MTASLRRTVCLSAGLPAGPAGPHRDRATRITVYLPPGLRFDDLVAGCLVLGTRCAGWGEDAPPVLHRAGPRPVTTRIPAPPEIPFADLVERVRRAGEGQTVDPGVVASCPIQVRERGAEPVAGRFAVTIEAGPDGTASLTYDPGRFDHPGAVRLAGYLTTLLTAAREDAVTPLGLLPLLGAGESADLAHWGYAEGKPCDLTVHELVGRQARLAPETTAVTGATRLSYRELDHASARLANVLLAEGVAPGSVVGICVPRGAGLVVAMLAVLRAGCAYLPVNPDQPGDRLRRMARDAGMAVCLTDTAVGDRIPGVWPVFTDDEVLLSGQPETVPPVPCGPGDLAYVLYTSGSTGTPKGTQIEHRSITRLVAEPDFVRLGPGDVVVQVADPAFDAVTFEIWAPLVAGGSVLVLPKEVLLDPAALAGALREHRATTMFVTTAVFNQIAAGAPETFGSLTTLLFGGEAVSPAMVAQVLAAQPPKRLLHVYGPTETTTFATWHLVTDVDPAATVPIGRPISGTVARVLDERSQPVPVGVVGELYLGGLGVARGYLGLPELTGRRFPVLAGTGRCYRTGDLVRWTAAGALEFVGRADRQVKVRGYRIEPEEIELVLKRHPRVRSALVDVQVHDGGKQLIAYAVGAGDVATDLEQAELRSFLAERLPDYLVPAAVVVLTAFPLTVNGKVDRRALPAPVFPSAGGEAAPWTALERALERVWAEVLGLDSVGVTDNFYEVGGDSVLGIRLVVAARKAGLPLTSKHVFQLQTIAEQAAELATVVPAAAQAEAH